MVSKRPKILAISSGGGHWVQLLRLRPAFEGCDVTFATVKRSYQADIGNSRLRVIPDANRWNKVACIRSVIGIFVVLLRERPDVVISTGAAPGYFGVRLGKPLGARTIWLDSVANVEELSMSGQRARYHVDLWLTQWQHLAQEGGPFFRGGVF